MGYSKKLYNVLGGVTNSIIAKVPPNVYTLNSQLYQKQMLIFGNIA